MKFKNIKKKKYKKSPSNSRTINDPQVSFPKIDWLRLYKLYGKALRIFVVLIFFVAVVLVGYSLQKNLEIKNNIDFQRKILNKDLDFWEDFILKNKNWADAYFQASVLEYKLGDTVRAKEHLEKGLSLDPNSENGRKIEQLLK